MVTHLARVLVVDLVGSWRKEFRIFHLILLFNLHVHENLNRRLNVVYKRKTVHILHLSLFLPEQIFIIVVNFFVGPYLHAQVQFKDGFFEGFVRFGHLLSVFRGPMVREKVKVTIFISIRLHAFPIERTQSFQRPERVRDLRHNRVTSVIIIIDEPVV